MSDPIRIGIVGLGRAGIHGHLPELADKRALFSVVAGCDPIPERRQELAEKTGASGHETVDALLADERVELVDIANRTTDHFPTAKAAMEAGKMVLVEKPVCTNLRDTEALIYLDQSLGGGKLFVRHNRRFDHDFIHVQQIIASGILGDVFEIKLRRHQFQRRNDWQTVREFGGGQLLNWGAHVVDHALQLLEAPASAIWSDLKTEVSAGDAEDHVHIILRGENRRIVDIEISTGVALPEPVYQVYGTRGTLRGSPSRFALKYIDPEHHLQPREVDLSPPQGYGGGETLPWVEEEIDVAPENPGNMWDSLYAAIRSGTPYAISLEQVHEIMRVIQVAREQAGV
jgi:scyllo-inositol 2-dehydrogenase (NADP+)